MEFKVLRKYLNNKKGCAEELPFGPEVLVYKVMGKMFALVALEESPLRLSVKCDPELAEHLRRAYKAVQPAYHLNKKHWNSVILDGSLSEAQTRSFIDDSYNLVVKGLRKIDRIKLENVNE